MCAHCIMLRACMPPAGADILAPPNHAHDCDCGHHNSGGRICAAEGQRARVARNVSPLHVLGFLRCGLLCVRQPGPLSRSPGSTHEETPGSNSAGQAGARPIASNTLQYAPSCLYACDSVCVLLLRPAWWMCDVFGALAYCYVLMCCVCVRTRLCVLCACPDLFLVRHGQRHRKPACAPFHETTATGTPPQQSLGTQSERNEVTVAYACGPDGLRWRVLVGGRQGGACGTQRACSPAGAPGQGEGRVTLAPQS